MKEVVAEVEAEVAKAEAEVLLELALNAIKKVTWQENVLILIRDKVVVVVEVAQVELVAVAASNVASKVTSQESVPTASKTVVIEAEAEAEEEAQVA